MWRGRAQPARPPAAPRRSAGRRGARAPKARATGPRRGAAKTAARARGSPSCFAAAAASPRLRSAPACAAAALIVRLVSAPRRAARGHWDHGQPRPLIEPYLESPTMTWPFTKRLLDAGEVMPRFPKGETKAEEAKPCRVGRTTQHLGPRARKPHRRVRSPLIHPRPAGSSGDDADGGLRSRVLGTGNVVAGQAVRRTQNRPYFHLSRALSPAPRQAGPNSGPLTQPRVRRVARSAR